MKVLVLGGGGREHALAWKLASEPIVREVLCAPGNPGTASTARNVDVSATDLGALAALADHESIDLTVVGPELPLDRGIVDFFTSRGLRIFGPTRAAAQLECSKVFAKTSWRATAFHREISRAMMRGRHAIVQSGDWVSIVVKADGLAAGRVSRWRIVAQRIRPFMPRWKTGSSARLVRAWCSKSVSPGPRSRSLRCATAPARLR
jgi:phosphoribosylamine--glycine ligase